VIHVTDELEYIIKTNDPIANNAKIDVAEIIN
jgi:hypothetical protein